MLKQNLRPEAHSETNTMWLVYTSKKEKSGFAINKKCCIWQQCMQAGQPNSKCFAQPHWAPKHNMLLSGPSNVPGCKPSNLGLLPQSHTNFSATMFTLCEELCQLSLGLTSFSSWLLHKHLESSWLYHYLFEALHETAARTNLNLEYAISLEVVSIQAETDRSEGV